MVQDYFSIKAALLSAAFLFGISGCTTIDAPDRSKQITDWAVQRGFSAASIKAGAFHLFSFTRGVDTRSSALTIYIEGDGAPWITPYYPPLDPTPLKPVSLALAAVDPAPMVVYLGRPCQYQKTDELGKCDSTYWVERRFAPEVIAAYDEAINQLKTTFGVKQLRLVGYSGGGVIVALLAAQRNDVESLVTVAAPLAVSRWVVWHKILPLTGSLDPDDLDGNVHLPQGVHFFGGKDEIVPPFIAEDFIRRTGGRMVVVQDSNHDCCWERDWAALLAHEFAQGGVK